MKIKYLILTITLVVLGCRNQEGDFVCTPCDLPCDELSFDKPGICPHCKMKLIHKSDIFPELYLTLNNVDLNEISGKFLIEGGKTKNQPILIHYHKPRTISPNTKAIIVLPGAGRNGRDYMESWMEHSEKYDLLVIVPTYLENHYPEFWSYNLAGMISDVNLNDESFSINNNPQDWIFRDFDRIYKLIQSKLSLNSEKYDMFGHSAGGQILHRLAIFNSKNNADRIVAANSGWYSIPTNSENFPYGLNNIKIAEENLDFSSNLIVLLGELDNEHETRGHLRHSPEVDKQGMHRLSRGKYFFEQSMHVAKNYDKQFNWKLKIAPNIGHDYIEIGKKAAEYLYEK